MTLQAYKIILLEKIFNAKYIIGSIYVARDQNNYVDAPTCKVISVNYTCLQIILLHITYIEEQEEIIYVQVNPFYMKQGVLNC